MITFSNDQAAEMARLGRTDHGRYLACRQENLIAKLLRPQQGERLLLVGAVTSEALIFYLRRGCLVTVLTPAACLLDDTEGKTGSRIDYEVGSLEDFPFSDDQFDIVVLQAALEFTAAPCEVIDEAIRVSSGRVFIGAKNSLSPFFLGNRRECFFPESIRRRARSYTFPVLYSLVRERLAGVEISWGSCIFFPYRLSRIISPAMEAKIPLLKNPFGAFLGFSFPVSYRFRTAQQVITKKTAAFKEGKTEPARGLVRGGQRESQQ